MLDPLRTRVQHHYRPPERIGDMHRARVVGNDECRAQQDCRKPRDGVPADQRSGARPLDRWLGGPPIALGADYDQRQAACIGDHFRSVGQPRRIVAARRATRARRKDNERPVRIDAALLQQALGLFGLPLRNAQFQFTTVRLVAKRFDQVQVAVGLVRGVVGRLDPV